MDAWAGFWIAIAIYGSTELIVDFLKWKTKKIYNINDKIKKSWWRI